MSDGMNPYNSTGQAPAYGGGNNYRNNGGGYGGGGGGYRSNNSYKNNSGGYKGGGGFKGGGGGFKGKTYTPEEIANAQIPRAVVISGNEQPTGPASDLAMRLTAAFEKAGFVVRSGGLRGFDEVVKNSGKNVELHLPFKNFNQQESASQFSNEICTELARRYAPDLDNMQNVPRAILAKNPRLVFGRYLNSPAQLIIVWSDDGCEHPREVTPRSGCVGHIVKMANAAGIRIINLQRPDAEQRAMKFLENIYVEQQQAEPATPTGPAGPASYQQPSQGQPAAGYGSNNGSNQSSYGGNGYQQPREPSFRNESRSYDSSYDQ